MSLKRERTPGRNESITKDLAIASYEEPRKTAERALVAVAQKAWIQGVTPRRGNACRARRHSGATSDFRYEWAGAGS